MKRFPVFYPQSKNVECGQIPNRKYAPNLKLDAFNKVIGIEGLYRDFDQSGFF